MSDQPGDSLLRQLGALARERNDTDDADRSVDEISSGNATLPPEPTASGPRENELPREWEEAASQPLDAEAQQRIVQTLETVLAAERPESRKSQMTSHSLPAAQAAQAAQGAPWKQPANWYSLAAAAVLLILISSLFLRWLLQPEGPGHGQTLIAELPTYSLTVEGLTRSERSSPSAETLTGKEESQPLEGRGRKGTISEVALGNRLVLTLTPKSTFSAPLTAAAFISCRESWRKLDNELLKLSPHGALRMELLVGQDLQVETGDSCQLLMTVGQEKQLPSRQEALAASLPTGEGSGKSWRAVHLTIKVTS